MQFEDFLNDLPLLHTWDGGETWVTGGFRPHHLQRIRELVIEHFPSGSVNFIETGAGASTLTFLQTSPGRVLSIAPDEELRDRITNYCADVGITVDSLEYVLDRSERALPPIAFDNQRFDVGLIDGGHGWPTVFVDFCYVNMMMRRGALLIIDDLQLHSVAELGRLLEQQQEFELVEDLGKLQVFRKSVDRRFLPDHNGEPYINGRSVRSRKPGPIPAT
ncbi:MAG: class I SAM-dependent methyltransferase [Acidimicrobiales bacterium]